MTQPVSLPLWLVIFLVVFATLATLDYLIRPSLRWVLRRRVQRVLEDLESRFQIRGRPFKLTKRQVLIDRLIYDREVVAAAERHAQQHEMRSEEVLDQVQRYASEIVPAFNAYFYFRLGYGIARRIARSLYRVRLGLSDEGGLTEIDQSSTVVFVINHRSNMDYVLVSYLVAEKAVLSYAVGEWARIFPLESLIRSMGAYFVRRRSRNDLYRKVLQRYVQMATAEGVTQAVFPEGGLSRDGSLREPKLGLLDYMLREFDPEGERDLAFVPVALNYDRVLEDRTLLLDLDSGADRKKGLAAAHTTGRFVTRQLQLMMLAKWHRFGYACVNFGSPVFAKAYLAERDLDLRILDKEERFARVGELAEHLMGEIGRIVPVTPVALVATVLLREPDRNLSDLELKAEVQRLIDRLEASGHHVYVPRHDREYAIDVGLRMLVLRRVVGRGDDGLLAVELGELPLLRYYANSIAHLDCE
jgi:glycerol-3-phosphate O-acyltransferase